MKTAMQTLGVLAVAFAATALGGCEEEKQKSEATEADAAPTGPAVDPDLAEAVEAASAKKAGAGAQGAGGEKGPPPNGIFGPGEADAELAKGAAPKITLGSEGSAPRVTFSHAVPAAGWKRSGTVELSLRAGRGQLPAVNTTLAFEAAKPKEGEPPGVPVTAKVNKASLAETGAGAAELDQLVKKMKGSRIGFRVLPSGASDDFGSDLAKDAAKDLDSLLRPMSEVLAAVTMPYPDKPVGKGAFWMVTSRENVMGTDVVTYRLVKLEELTDGIATLNLSIKRYAASTSLQLPGIPPGAKLEQFQSVSEGKLMVNPTAPLLPTSGSLRQTFLAMLDAGEPPPGADPQQGQRLTAQTASEAKLDFPLPKAKAPAAAAP